MKNISEALQVHLQQEVTTIATCWKMKRRDGQVLCFTDYDRDLEIEENVYRAETGFTPSAIQTTAGLAVDNLDIDGMLDSSSITEDEIHAGKYDFAEIEVFLVNYNDLAQGKLVLRTGWLGEVSWSGQQFMAEVRGLTQRLSQKVGNIFAPTCRALFGDGKCGINLESYTYTGEIDEVLSRLIFKDSGLVNEAGYFANGKVKFTTGSNAGISIEVKEFANGVVSLALPIPFDMEVGDNYEIVAGCDKNFKTCADKFSNAVNFRGEPHVPGMDKILETSGTRKK